MNYARATSRCIQMSRFAVKNFQPLAAFVYVFNIMVIRSRY